MKSLRHEHIIVLYRKYGPLGNTQFRVRICSGCSEKFRGSSALKMCRTQHFSIMAIVDSLGLGQDISKLQTTVTFSSKLKFEIFKSQIKNNDV